MTKGTKKFMRSVRSKLEKCIGLHMTACGHDGPTIEALRCEDKLLAFIQTEFERLEMEAMGPP